MNSRTVTRSDLLPANAALNAVCPYYTMFPLSFPQHVLQRATSSDEWVLDPFCGRGTTNFAARLSRLPTLGIDSNPVAFAIAKSKLAQSEPDEVTETAKMILGKHRAASSMPRGEFWRLAYHRETLREICILRDELMKNCRTNSRQLLRAIILGALHGPLGKSSTSYFSNQAPRTFSPKPGYATRYWKDRELRPPRVDLLDIVSRRAERFLELDLPRVDGSIRFADSRSPASLRNEKEFSWVITSPPYFGMRTYEQDQWLRGWFLGGPDSVEYHHSRLQMSHRSAETFANQLRLVWGNARRMSKGSARLVCRFGGIHDRATDPLDIISSSFRASGWRITTLVPAGTALLGKRQAIQFRKRNKRPKREYDIYAVAV